MMISVLLLVTYSKQIKIKHILKFILTFFNIIKQSIKIELVWIPKGFPKALSSWLRALHHVDTPWEHGVTNALLAPALVTNKGDYTLVLVCPPPGGQVTRM